ncbi:right-handed parallel beta-helix repeat-containing protein [Tichowtungia aerotolerans]|uniref:Right handed beta helix domain-containing protein n=1 Tax=Tichowtungia aerotolerans TaxID=2697043 RepID=A0A6P1MAL8_9BACT|nr:right-handed parallel beta-helix repeat-containing protein [Tichowtungia aerotolerans]QHI69148.1 hypothetical protein GT409_06690 [Tichowtungia aerotolerans]
MNVIKKKICFSFVLAGLLVPSVQAFVFKINAPPARLYVDDFGAVGDGMQDDISAVVASIEALRDAGPGAILEFSSGKTYKLGMRPDSNFQVDLQGMTNVTVEGNGAILLNTPYRASVRMQHCDGVTVRNFEIEQAPLGYTQGIITNVSPAGGFFEMEIMEGYNPIPAGMSFLDWGAVIDPDLRRIRWDMRDHFRPESYIAVGPEQYRLYMQSGYITDLNDVHVGDIYFQPLIFNGYASNIHITNSKDCLLENVTLYSGRSSMSSRVDLNPGRITVRGFKVMVRPGSERFVSNWRDGVHCKDNRIGPIIEDCYFEALLDDSINMSQNTVMASEIISSNTFRMTKAEGPTSWTEDSSSMHAGDRIMVFYPPTGEYIGPVRVASVDSNSREIITFEEPILNVVTGRVVSGDTLSTHFYNLDMCNARYIIRNNVFKPQRRHAILARSVDGIICGNRIEGVGGNGILLENEYGGPFFAGPFPQNILVSNNTIISTHLAPVRIHSSTGVTNSRLARNIELAGNQIIGLDTSAVELDNAQDVAIRENNVFYEINGTEMLDPVQAVDSENIFYVPTVLRDGGFEMTFLDPDNNGYEYCPEGLPWTFSPLAGYTESSTAYTSGNPPPPEGDQVLLLKGAASAFQPVTLSEGSYTVALYAAQRKNFGDQIQQMKVLLNGVSLGTFRPGTSGDYEPFESSVYTVPVRSTCILKLEALLNIDETLFIDDVRINKQ